MLRIEREPHSSGVAIGSRILKGGFRCALLTLLALNSDLANYMDQITRTKDIVESIEELLKLPERPISSSDLAGGLDETNRVALLKYYLDLKERLEQGLELNEYHISGTPRMLDYHGVTSGPIEIAAIRIGLAMSNACKIGLFQSK